MFNQNGRADDAFIFSMIVAFFIGFGGTWYLYHIPNKHVVKQEANVEVIEPNAKLVLDMAAANDFKPSNRVVAAIVHASAAYGIGAEELTAIAIVETGLGRDSLTRKNKNGTTDRGLFQINSVNYSKCLEYNLDTPEGSSLCAAKLLSILKQKRSDYLGAYHSKTPSKKQVYLEKLNEVMDVASRE